MEGMPQGNDDCENALRTKGGKRTMGHKRKLPYQLLLLQVVRKLIYK